MRYADPATTVRAPNPFPQPIDPVIDDELYVVDPPFDEDSPT